MHILMESKNTKSYDFKLYRFVEMIVKDRNAFNLPLEKTKTPLFLKRLELV